MVLVYVFFFLMCIMFGSLESRVCKLDIEGSMFKIGRFVLFCRFLCFVFKDLGGDGYLGWCLKLLLLFMYEGFLKFSDEGFDFGGCFILSIVVLLEEN